MGFPDIFRSIEIHAVRKRVPEIKALMFSEEDFRKFTDPKHPQYKDYKDRENEHWHDKGWNNALEYVIKVLLQ